MVRYSLRLLLLLAVADEKCLLCLRDGERALLTESDDELAATGDSVLSSSSLKCDSKEGWAKSMLLNEEESCAVQTLPSNNDARDRGRMKAASCERAASIKSRRSYGTPLDVILMPFSTTEGGHGESA